LANVSPNFKFQNKQKKQKKREQASHVVPTNYKEDAKGTSTPSLGAQRALELLTCDALRGILRQTGDNHNLRSHEKMA
jgi:hypothetical protein